MEQDLATDEAGKRLKQMYELARERAKRYYGNNKEECRRRKRDKYWHGKGLKLKAIQT